MRFLNMNSVFIQCQQTVLTWLTVTLYNKCCPNFEIGPLSRGTWYIQSFLRVVHLSNYRVIFERCEDVYREDFLKIVKFWQLGHAPNVPCGA